MSSLYQKIIPNAIKPLAQKEEISTLLNKLEENQQIQLDIKVKKENQVKKIRRRTKSWIEILHINPYWKIFSSVGMLVSSLASSGIILFMYVFFNDRLPNLIPSIYNQASKLWQYTPKDEFIILPVLHLIITAILIRLNLYIFKYDRRLVLVLNSSMILINIIYLLAIFNIYTMLFVY